MTSERRVAKATRRAWQHGELLRAAPTKRDQLRTILGWILAEVSRRSNQHRMPEVIDAVLDLVYRLQQKLPMPERAHGAPTIRHFTAPRAARRARGIPPD